MYKLFTYSISSHFTEFTDIKQHLWFCFLLHYTKSSCCLGCAETVTGAYLKRDKQLKRLTEKDAKEPWHRDSQRLTSSLPGLTSPAFSTAFRLFKDCSDHLLIFFWVWWIGSVYHRRYLRDCTDNTGNSFSFYTSVICVRFSAVMLSSTFLQQIARFI